MDRAITDLADPDLNGEEIIEISGRFEIAMELCANRKNIEDVERFGIRKPHRAIHLCFGDLEETHVAAEVDNAGVIDVRPADAVLYREAFSCHDGCGNYCIKSNVPERPVTDHGLQ